jgi:alpha-glucosidase
VSLSCSPAEQAIQQGLPPNRTTAPPPSNVPIVLSRRTNTNSTLNYLDPPYAIDVATNGLSDRSAYTSIVHANGLMEYDTREYGCPLDLDWRFVCLIMVADSIRITLTQITSSAR